MGVRRRVVFMGVGLVGVVMADRAKALRVGGVFHGLLVQGLQVAVEAEGLRLRMAGQKRQKGISLERVPYRGSLIIFPAPESCAGTA